MPRMSDGKRRPHRGLLQSDVVVWFFTFSVDGSLRSSFVRNCGDVNETPSLRKHTSNSKEDSFRWVVGLGRYTPERVSGVPKGVLRRDRNSP